MAVESLFGTLTKPDRQRKYERKTFFFRKLHNVSVAHNISLPYVRVCV